MTNIIPFYVREFNAASIAEAIHAADQALRIDGVTVAVWRNHDHILSAEVKAQRYKLLREFMGAAQNCFGMSAKETNENLDTEKTNISFPEISACITYMQKAIDNTLSISQDFTGNAKLLPNPETFIDLTLQRTPLLFDGSRYLTTWLNFELGYTLFEEIHVDGCVPNHKNDNSKLFSGDSVRMIENLYGAPTRFFANKAGDDEYALPQNSIAFFKREHPEQAAWHASSPSRDHSRVVCVTEFQFCN